MSELEIPESHEWQWLLRRIQESDPSGPLQAAVENLGFSVTGACGLLARAFGKLIALTRCARKWRLEDLAAHSRLDEDHLRAFEAGDLSSLDPRAVSYLAAALKLPDAILLELAEFVEPSSPALHDAACLLDAQSGPERPQQAKTSIRKFLNLLNAPNRRVRSHAVRLNKSCPRHKEK
jgi:hypothetical protein